MNKQEKFDSLLGVNPLLPPWEFFAPSGGSCGNVKSTAIRTSEVCERADLFTTIFKLRSVKRLEKLDTESFYRHAASILVNSRGDKELANKEGKILSAKVLDDLRLGKSSLPPEIVEPVNRSRDLGLALASYTWASLDRGDVTAIGVNVPLSAKILPQSIPCEGQANLILKDEMGNYWLTFYMAEESSIDMCIRELPNTIEGPLLVEIARDMMRLNNDRLPEEMRFINPDKLRGFSTFIILKPNVKRTRIGTVKEQTLESYLLECEYWWAGMGKWVKFSQKRKDNPPISIQPIDVPMEMAGKVRSRILKYVEMYQPERPYTETSYPPHEMSCRRCQFFEICSQPCTKWLSIVKKEYTQRTNPLM